jgi:hypothetical protein
MKTFKFELGERVKDIVTGFSGVIMARSEFFTGCDQYGIAETKLNKEGKRGDWEYFDETRLIKIGKGIKLPVENEKKRKANKKSNNGFDGNYCSKL